MNVNNVVSPSQRRQCKIGARQHRERDRFHQMTVQFVANVLTSLETRLAALGALRLSISAPWHFKEFRKTRLEVESEGGLYLYTRPASPDWKIPAATNASDVWYVGKSDRNLTGRVWNHMGVADPAQSTHDGSPRFSRHKWAKNCDYIGANLLSNLEKGEVVVYTVAIDGVTGFGYTPELIEKHVLVEYALKYGALPALNRQICQGLKNGIEDF